MAHTLPEYLDRLVQIQCGVLSAQQAMAGGMTRDMIRARVRNGRWRKLQYGVYATFPGEPGRDANLWAAVLRVGRGAVLSYYVQRKIKDLDDAYDAGDVPATAYWRMSARLEARRDELADMPNVPARVEVIDTD